jgi:hypothetical protein
MTKDKEQWQLHFDAEIQQAETARLAGNEGMARVCARRAAGWVVGEYFRRREIPFESPSAYERLQVLLQIPNVDDKTKELAGHFLVRITPEHELPINADLIAEARWLKASLLGSDVC